MENTIDLKTFLQRLKLLPEDLQEAVLTVGFLDRLKKIQQENSLHIDQGASLEDAVFKLVLGDLSAEEFPKKIVSTMFLSDDEALKIAQAVEKNLLEPIRDAFQEIQNENDELGEEEKPLVDEDDNYSELSTEEILTDIENPTPSVGVEHEVSLPSNAAPLTPIAPVPTKVAANSTSSENQNTNVPTGWPTPAQNTSTTPAVSQTTTALNQKLEQPVVSRPTEIKHSLDPYLEPVE